MRADEIFTLWTHTRSAHAARAFAARTPASEALPTGRSAKAVDAWEKAWKTQGTRALPALLQALTTGTSAMARDRLNLLSSTDHPLIDAHLLGWLVSMPYRTKPHCSAFWSVVLKRLRTRAIADVAWERLAEEIRAGRTNFAVSHAARVARLATEVTQPERPLSDDERRALAGLGFADPEAPAAAPRDVTALFEAVWSDPDDHDARTILSDALQQIGDPRGDFIAQQMQTGIQVETYRLGKHTYAKALEGDGADPRVQALCELAKAHVDDWLGEWVTIVCKVVWKDGFPIWAEPYSKWAKVGKLTDAPSLRTVRTFVVPREEKRGGVRKVLKSSAAANLQSLEGAVSEDLDPLKKALGTRLSRLELRVGSTLDVHTLAAQLVHWPALRQLRLRSWDSTPWFELDLSPLRVPHLELACTTSDSPAWMDGALSFLAGQLHASVNTFVMAPRGACWTALRSEDFGTVRHTPSHPEYGVLDLAQWINLAADAKVEVSDGSWRGLAADAGCLGFLRELGAQQGRLEQLTLDVTAEDDVNSLLDDLPALDHLTLEGSAHLATAPVLQRLSDTTVRTVRLNYRDYKRSAGGSFDG